jgi:hypothetical protein
MYSPRTGGAYLGARPSRKKVLGVCRHLNELVKTLPPFIPPEALVYQVNGVLRGWANYFCFGTYTSTFKLVHMHACRRVRRWLHLMPCLLDKRTASILKYQSFTPRTDTISRSSCLCFG